jgi:hypothetical protein
MIMRIIAAFGDWQKIAFRKKLEFDIFRHNGSRGVKKRFFLDRLTP